jgi:glycine/D-amino acid oxidase-like deaminating enzyme
LFEPKYSLQFASYKKDVGSLEKEYAIRKQHGFKVDLLSHPEIKNDYGFDAPAALLVHEAAQLDAYVLTHNILKNLPGDTVFDHTEIVQTKSGKNAHLLTTNDGFTIKCKHVVIACGYESSKYLGKNIWEELRCTFAFISEPLPQRQLWKDNCLIWETADPYLYIRACDNNLILVGGKDTRYLPTEKQLKLLPQKTTALKKAFEKKFPHLPLKVDFKWAGTFATTEDGLPFIGELPAFPRTFFALGYGGNGITFSYIAARQIASAIKGEKHRYVNLFSFERK